MPDEDAKEIEKQVQELVDAGLVEPFPKGKVPTHCTPTFLVAKKRVEDSQDGWTIQKGQFNDEVSCCFFAQYGAND